MNRFLIFILLMLMLPASHAAIKTVEDSPIDILIVRHDKQLHVRKNNEIIRSFHVALGSGGRGGKQREGDRRTPMGTYQIMEIRPSEQFHMFMHLNYPNRNDAREALQDGRIDRYLFRRILAAHIYGEVPPQNTVLGGAIGIHGIGYETQEKIDIHKVSNWTLGCIALRNSEVRELQKYVQVGTTVTIIDRLETE